MTTIVTRAGKGSPLTNTEVDTNFTNLNSDKLETSGGTLSGPTVVSVNSSSAALRITQTGAGNALVVEDSANPDATPFAVNASGNVGIGTSSPGTTRLYISSNRATDPTLQTWDTFNGATFENSALLSYDGTKTFFYNFQANPLAFGTNNAERMRIDSSGNVGIGTNAPASPLQVSGTARFGAGPSDATNATVAMYSDGTGISIEAFQGNNVATKRNIWLNAYGGNVGIGTSSPGSLLTVDGNLAFNSGYGSAAVAYGCRAWVNFNGTGTVAIRASGNVTSITDNGTGDYTVNFTNAMPDANYTLSTASNETGSAPQFICLKQSTAPSTGSVRVQARYGTSWSTQDVSYAFVSIIR